MEEALKCASFFRRIYEEVSDGYVFFIWNDTNITLIVWRVWKVGLCVSVWSAVSCFCWSILASLSFLNWKPWSKASRLCTDYWDICCDKSLAKSKLMTQQRNGNATEACIFIFHVPTKTNILFSYCVGNADAPAERNPRKTCHALSCWLYFHVFWTGSFSDRDNTVCSTLDSSQAVHYMLLFQQTCSSDMAEKLMRPWDLVYIPWLIYARKVIFNSSTHTWVVCSPC